MVIEKIKELFAKLFGRLGKGRNRDVVERERLNEKKKTLYKIGKMSEKE